MRMSTKCLNLKGEKKDKWWETEKDLGDGLIKQKLRPCQTWTSKFIFHFGVTFLFPSNQRLARSRASMRLSENPSDGWCFNTAFYFCGVGCLAMLPNISPSLLCLPACLSFVKPQDAHTQLNLVNLFCRKYKIGCLLWRCSGKQKMLLGIVWLKNRGIDGYTPSVCCLVK